MTTEEKRNVKGIARRLKNEDSAARKAASGSRKRATTADSYQNLAAGLGLQTGNLSSGSGYGFNPITRYRTRLEWIHRGSWLGGVAVDLVADDMTRAGVDIKGEMKPEEIEKIQEAAVAFGVWNSFNSGIRWGRLYGGSIVVPMIAGQKFSAPLRIDTIGKDQFRGLMVFDRWQVDPSLGDLVTEMGPDVGMPKYYQVSNDAPALMGEKIHYSRATRLIGIGLPYWQAVIENLWGISVLERLYDRMVAFDSATTGAAQLAYKAFLRTYSIKGLRNIVASGGKNFQGLLKHVEFMRYTQSIEGMTLLDDQDKLEALQVQSFSGLDDLLRQLGEQLSGALQIPLTRLFGQSPGGLDSSGDSDLRTYYDGINQQQESTLKRGVTSIYRAMAQSQGIKVPDGFGITFRPLWQLSETDKATIASTNIETIIKAKDAMLISEQTAMKEMKQQSAITGMGTNITDKDIRSAETERVPPASELMPGPEDGEGGAPGGVEEAEGGSGGGKGRSGDAAKASKPEAEYTDSSPFEKKRCALCKHFLSKPDAAENAHCEVVEGVIAPGGYCDWFEPK